LKKFATPLYVMAMAVQNIYQAQVTIGPWIEKGFTTTLTIQSRLQKGSESHPERDGEDYQS